MTFCDNKSCIAIVQSVFKNRLTGIVSRNAFMTCVKQVETLRLEIAPGAVNLAFEVSL